MTSPRRPPTEPAEPTRPTGPAGTPRHPRHDPAGSAPVPPAPADPTQPDPAPAEPPPADRAPAGGILEDRALEDRAGDGHGRASRWRSRGWWSAVDRARGGLAADLGLYLISAGFAGITAATSTLLPHRAWGTVAIWGYAAAALVVLAQMLAGGSLRTVPTAPARSIRPGPARAGLTWLTWLATGLLPLVVEAVQRAGGRTDRAQEEVLVIEQAGQRLLDHGTPYLTRDAIAALPEAERLLGYLPYQPGMALFGLPRAAAGAAWWTDARVWFAVVTAVALLAAVRVLRAGHDRAGHDRAGHDRAGPGAGPVWTVAGGGSQGDGARPLPGRRDGALVRAVQAATVLPVCALTLATGGDDLPVLALCLLALACCAGRRYGLAGLVIGVAGALKLFAWPVTLVLLVHALTRGRRTAIRFAAGAVGLPVAAMLPAMLVDPGALAENVIRFPLGHGLVSSPAESPFPGHLIASAVPAGRAVAAALLAAAGLGIAAWLLRRPPRTAGAAARISGYGLLAAILLMPSTRFGYLLYPAAFLIWAPALRPPGSTAPEPARPAKHETPQPAG